MGYEEDSRRIKALADPNRLYIMKSLQHGEKCACYLLDEMRISQPTLSHHMRILCDSGLVEGRKDGKWMYYSISSEGAAAFREMIAYYVSCDVEGSSPGAEQ